MDFAIFLTERCNLNCKYCDPYNEMKNMPSEPQYSIGDLLNFLKNYDNLEITFYGGEPLLNIKYLENIIDMISAKKFILQTNGIYLNRIKPKYLKKIDTILLSIDGRRETTDSNRGKGVFDKIMTNLKLIERNFDGEIVARMTVVPGADLYKDVMFLIKNDIFKFTSIHWQLDVLFNKYENKNDIILWLKEDYNPAVSDLINWWISNMKETLKSHRDTHEHENSLESLFSCQNNSVIRIYPFVGIIKTLLDKKPTILRCGASGISIDITTSGELYPCPLMRNNKKYCMGNIWKKEISKPLFVGEPCISCEYLWVCGGRCLYSNHNIPDQESYNYVCQSVQYLINTLNSYLPDIKELITNRFLSFKDFEYPEYNGCEIIP